MGKEITMQLTVSLVLAVIALVLTVVSAIGKCPLWIPVVILAIIALVQAIPLK
jgi:lysylphosphatidylglycerol synthetase-like protein (DUF2156 family)